MIAMVLDFHGGGELVPIWTILIGVSLVLCTLGSVQMGRRRWASGGGLLAAGLLIVLSAFFPGAKIPVLIVQLLAVMVGVYVSSYSSLGPKKWTLLLLLRGAAIFALLLILLKPAIILPLGDTDTRGLIAIAVDRSGSMGVIDEPSTPDRYSQSLRMLRSQQKRIEKNFRTSWYGFGSGADRVESFGALAELSPSGGGSEATNFSAALDVIANPKPEGLTAVVLISDGINNGPDPITAGTQLKVPVYTLGVGSQQTRAGSGATNLQLLGVDAPMAASGNNAAELTVNLAATNLAGQLCTVKLFEADATTATAETTITPTADSETLTATLKWTPRIFTTTGKPGLCKLRISATTAPQETNLSDNTSELHMLVTNPQLGVLYVEGTIRPEYKYLQRMLQSDPNVQFFGLVRVAENKFWAQGSIDGKQLAGLPQNDKQFAMFDVIILGDIDSSFFTESQLAGLKKFVSDGGGVIMLGGRNSFGAGGYAATPLADILPVEIPPRDDGNQQSSVAFVPQLTAAGEAHPIFAGIAGFFPGPGGRAPDAALPKLPPLSGCVRVTRAKRAAETLAIDPNDSNANSPLVTLTVQKFGAGRSVAFTADTTWKWYLPMRSMGQQSPYFRFWGQMVRWVAGVDAKTKSGGGAAVLRVSSNHARVGAEPLGVTVQVTRDPSAAPAGENAKITCDVLAGDKTFETITLEPGASRGLYKGSWTPKSPGRYVVKLTGAPVDIHPNFAALPVSVFAGSGELANLTRNDKLLQQIAYATRGKFADIAAFPDLLDEIIAKQTRVAGIGLDGSSQISTSKAARTRRLYNFPILFIAFVVLLTTEWYLRRKWQNVA